MIMNRREALSAIAVLPAMMLTRAPHLFSAGGTSATTAVTKAATFISTELRFRRTKDGADIFDEDGSIEIGTVVKSFTEQWECDATFKPIRCLVQEPRGSYRVVGEGEKACFIFRNFEGDPLTIRLAPLTEALS